MASRRMAKVAQAILESISTTILFQMRDPRVKNVTILRVEPSQDLRTAKVYVSILGDKKQQELTLHGLDSARGFIQSKVADRIQTRQTPVLKFILDTSVKKSADISTIIDEALADGMVTHESDSELTEGSVDEINEEETGHTDSF
jgi:ribosome-binding factor A